MSVKPLLLLIEDNQVDTLLIKEIFTEIDKGFNLECVETLSAGMELLANKDLKFDAVLIDLYLPDSQGLETFTKVHLFAPDLAIVILTSLNDEMISIRAVQEGAQDYLIKGQVSGQLVIRSIRYAIERKQIETALSESQKRYKSLFEDSPTPMWEEDFSAVKIDIEKLKESGVNDFSIFFDNNPDIVKSLIKKVKVLDINKAVLKLHNAFNKEDIFNDLTIVFTEQTYTAIRYELTMIADGVRTFDFNQIVKTIDNKFRHIIVRWSVTPNNEFSLSSVLISIIDITEIKTAELALRESQFMLNEAQKVAHIGSWTFNPKSGEVTWSEELFRIHGLDPLKVSPKFYSFRKFFNLTDWNKFLKALQKLKKDSQDFEIELNIIRQNGEERVLLSKGRIKHKENGELLIVVTAQDITDRKAAEIELNNIDNLKTEFLVFISQQIRTPLDAVVSTLNLIMNQDHSKAIKQLIETLNDSVLTLENYTNKAFLFSQLSQKKYWLKINPLHLRELVQFAVLELNSKIKSKLVEVEIQKLQNNLFINADRDLLFKSLVYILDNAIEYSPLKGKIDITFNEDENRILCRINDYGPGFKQDQLRMLVHPLKFESGKSYQKSGISLYLVKLIMDLNGGTMQIYNQEGAGACVELEFSKQS